MKALALGLQASLVTVYDQTKTTLQGRAAQRTITDGNGAKLVIGPSPVVTADIFDDTGVAPAGLHCATDNGRVFIGKGFAAGVLTVSYYTLNASTGVATWIGDLKFAFTNTGAYTLRGFAVDDTSSSSMNFSFFVTNTTVQQGGWYADFGVNITDFVKVSVQTHPIATLASTNKSVYQIGDTVTQAAHTVTVADGGDIDSVGGFAYILNGVAATPKIFKFVNTVPTAVPVAGYSQANGTIVVTAVLPALTGTVLLVNCVTLGTPGTWSSNSGSLCLTWLTTTQIYHAKVSDITNGAVSLPSLASGSMLISGNYLTPTAAFGQYSPYLDKFVIMTTLGQVIVKQGITTDPNARSWGLNTYIKTETGGTVTPCDFGAVTNLSLADMAGWAIMVNTSVGQRNFVALDVFSDEIVLATAPGGGTLGQINTSIISPVLSGNFTQGAVMAMYYELAKRSVKPTVQFRTANFSTGPGVGFDATWTTVPIDGDLSTLVNASQVQFRFLFTMMGAEVTQPPQLNECHFLYTDNTQLSEKWVGASSNTSSSGSNPFRVSFRLQNAYPTTVPKLFVRGVDDSGNAVVFDTVTNIANFDYTTNNGTSYTPLGTIPNTPLTTEVRFSWTSPDGVARRWSVSES